MKPNEPIKNTCKSCKPRVRKESVRLQSAELEQCGGKPKSFEEFKSAVESGDPLVAVIKPKSVKVEIPEPVQSAEVDAAKKTTNEAYEAYISDPTCDSKFQAWLGEDYAAKKAEFPTYEFGLPGIAGTPGDLGIEKTPEGHLFRHGLDTTEPVKTPVAILKEDPWHKKTDMADIVRRGNRAIHMPTPTVVRMTDSTGDYHCKRCDKDVINGRCECLTSPSPWEPKHYDVFDGKWLSDSRLLWTLILFIVAFLIWYHFHMTSKLNESHKQFDELLDEYYKAPLPQGNGEPSSPGVLPEKGKLDMRMIINAVIEETPYF